MFCPERWGIIEASTKSGKTVSAIAWLFEHALFDGFVNYWWIAPTRKQAEIAFRRMLAGLPPGFVVPNQSKLTLTLPNQHVVWFLTGEIPDNLYGEDVGAAVLDEFTRMREAAWHAVRSTLTATGGPARLIGNVKGRRNWGYVLARRAEAGEPHMHYARITWREVVKAGLIPVEEIEDARRMLPAAVFQELFEATASDDDTNPFGLSNIRACVEALKAKHGGLSPRKTVVSGFDLAKSQNWTVGVGFDDAMMMSRFQRYQKAWGETTDDILRTCPEDEWVLLDSTGVGDPIVEELQRRRLGGRIEGFKFTATSKQQLMEGLRLAFHQKSLGLFDDPAVISELEAMEYEYTRTGIKYQVPTGLDDDCVMALALAVQTYRDHALVPALTFVMSGTEKSDEEEAAIAAAAVQRGSDEVVGAIMIDGVWIPE